MRMFWFCIYIVALFLDLSMTLKMVVVTKTNPGPDAFERSKQLKAEKNLKTDAGVANFLLDTHLAFRTVIFFPTVCIQQHFVLRAYDKNRRLWVEAHSNHGNIYPFVGKVEFVSVLWGKLPSLHLAHALSDVNKPDSSTRLTDSWQTIIWCWRGVGAGGWAYFCFLWFSWIWSRLKLFLKVWTVYLWCLHLLYHRHIKTTAGIVWTLTPQNN